MTAEKLHDAIGLLPSDLVAETDRKRLGKQRGILWKRYVTMAACFAVVLSCGLFAARVFSPKGTAESAQEFAMDAAPMEQAVMEAPAAAVPEESDYEASVGTNSHSSVSGGGGAAATSEDTVCVLPEAEPEEYAIREPQYLMTPWQTELCIDSSQSTVVRSRQALEAYLDGLAEPLEAEELSAVYEEAWFETNDLLILRQPADRSEYRYEVQSLTQPDSAWVLTLRLQRMPEDNCPDPVLWHILVGVDKNLIEEGETVRTELTDGT